MEPRMESQHGLCGRPRPEGMSYSTEDAVFGSVQLGPHQSSEQMNQQHDHLGVRMHTPRRDNGIGYIDQAGARPIDGSQQ